MKTTTDLIREAREHKMNPEEQDEQIRSFAFGNTHYENSAITKADIERAMQSLKESQ